MFSISYPMQCLGDVLLPSGFQRVPKFQKDLINSQVFNHSLMPPLRLNWNHLISLNKSYIDSRQQVDQLNSSFEKLLEGRLCDVILSEFSITLRLSPYSRNFQLKYHSQKLLDPLKGSHPSQKPMYFQKSSKGWGHFRSQKLCCNISFHYIEDIFNS